MYAWTCSCGDGASALPTWDSARREGQLHACRAGRLRDEHVVLVRPADASAA